MIEIEEKTVKLASETLPALAQIRALEVGEAIIFPIKRRSSVRSMVSTYSVEWERTYTTASNVQEKIFTIRRTS